MRAYMHGENWRAVQEFVRAREYPSRFACLRIEAVGPAGTDDDRMQARCIVTNGSTMLVMQVERDGCDGEPAAFEVPLYDLKSLPRCGKKVRYVSLSWGQKSAAGSYACVVTYDGELVGTVDAEEGAREHIREWAMALPAPHEKPDEWELLDLSVSALMILCRIAQDRGEGVLTLVARMKQPHNRAPVGVILPGEWVGVSAQRVCRDFEKGREGESYREEVAKELRGMRSEALL